MTKEMKLKACLRNFPLSPGFNVLCVFLFWNNEKNSLLPYLFYHHCLGARNFYFMKQYKSRNVSEGCENKPTFKNKKPGTNPSDPSRRIIMCHQAYQKCRNIACPNPVRMLDIVQCPNHPSCQLELIRVSLIKGHKQYCESCEKFTPKERRRNRKKVQNGKKQAQALAELQAQLSQIEASRAERRARDPTAQAVAQEQEPFDPAVPFVEFQSAESEDEAHDAALTLLTISREQISTPPPTRPGPLRFCFPPPHPS